MGGGGDKPKGEVLKQKRVRNGGAGGGGDETKPPPGNGERGKQSITNGQGGGGVWGGKRSGHCKETAGTGQKDNRKKARGNVTWRQEQDKNGTMKKNRKRLLST